MLKFLGSWLRKKDGSVAVEFSLLLWPFVMLTLGIIEISFMYAAESLLEGATSQAARQVKTGQLQQSGAEDIEEAFRVELCSHIPVLIDCSKVQIEARVMDSFSDFDAMSAQYDEEGNFEPEGFAIGGSSSKVLVRAVYYYPALTPILAPMFPFPGRTRLFVATIVLQTEPYDFASEASS